MATPDDVPLTHADLKPLLDRIAQLESALQARDRDVDQLEARVAALEQADPPTIVSRDS